MNRKTCFLALIIFVTSLLIPFKVQARMAIAGMMKSKDGKPLPGLVLLEKGGFHNNKWYRGVAVDDSGRFNIEVDEAGEYGVHAYSSGYIYFPQAARVQAGKTTEVSPVLVPAPTRANDPKIKEISIVSSESSRGKALVKMNVADPNSDLGPQVMAFNATNGRPHAMNPPKRMTDLRANFPNGVYQIEVDTSKQSINPKDWYFVVADHQCNTTDVFNFTDSKLPAVMHAK